MSSILHDLLLHIFEKRDDSEAFNKMFIQYKELRAEVLLELSKDYKIPRITDPALREQLKVFLKEGDEFIENAKKSEHQSVRNFAKVMNKQLKPEFSPERLDELASDLFYTWFSGYDYVYRLIETGTIVIKNINFPEKLESLINELRHCLIFENYLAAGIMLRTIVEVGVNDVLDKEFDKPQLHTLEEKLKFLEGKSAFTKPSSILNAFRKQMNEYVHGNRLINKKYVKEHVDVVFECLESMYEQIHS